MVRILYFARVRETVGLAEESVDLPAGVADVAGLIVWLTTRGGAWAETFARPYRVAVNQTMATPDTVLADGDEVAVFPPVTGG